MNWKPRGRVLDRVQRGASGALFARRKGPRRSGKRISGALRSIVVRLGRIWLREAAAVIDANVSRNDLV